jgi:hypothetical protein
MGNKIDEAFYQLQNELKHYTKLSTSRPSNLFDAGFANGFAEAIRIVQKIRDGKFSSRTIAE